ncbi:hypothetical protein [Salibaculum griseiflavum]|uniref:hypothetical protein n=1 Tax=Salibaculum griseiflavum TaxID=1914409 RepID=UPI0011B25E7A|nr:hypothetical protein [Salibaculum griseiflavum]
MPVIATIFRILVGIIFGAAAGLALSPLLASFEAGEGAWGLLVMIGLGALLGGLAPTYRRSFGRGFLLLGACVFLLPISTMVLSGVAFNEVMAGTDEASQGAAAVGAGLAGGLMTGFAGFIGFVMGSVLLLIGLVLSLGGRREVIVVESPTHKAVKGQYERKEPRIK